MTGAPNGLRPHDLRHHAATLTRWDHQAEMRARYGYRNFGEPGVQLAPERRAATRVAIAHVDETPAVDDALDLSTSCYGS